ATVTACFLCAGQSCTAGERLLVHRDVREEFVAKLARLVTERIVLGDPFDERTTMGPLNNAGVAEKMDEHVADALERGASVVSGSAGGALANRLSADPSTRVLVLEAGRMDHLWDVFIHMPAALAFPIGNKRYDWMYESEPEPHMGGRRVYHARGKVLGGSSSINGMIFQRGNPLDYERWASEVGMETWDHAHCLPYFKR